MKYTFSQVAAGLCGLTGIAWFIFFYTIYPYHQFHKEQTLLFVYAADTLSAYTGKPALLSCLAGDFLTQFYLYAPVAALVLGLAAAAIGWLCYRLLRPHIPKAPAAAVALAVANWEMLRASGLTYPLSSTLSLAGGLALGLLYRAIRNPKRRLAAAPLLAITGYYLFGYGVLAFVLFVLIQTLTAKKGYPEALFMLLISVSLPPLTGEKQGLTPLQAYQYPATAWWDKPDLTHERLLAMDTEAYRGNWKKVKQLSDTDTSIPAAAYYYNLSHAVEGRLPEGLLQQAKPDIQGLFLPISSQSSYLSTLFAGESWFELGDMTMAEHATLLGMIFSPNHRGSRMAKRLAEINLINGDEAAARKYLRILSQTLFYRQWAAERIPGRESRAVKQWLEVRRANIPRTDTLRLSTTDLVKSLRHLVEANPHNQAARDYLLCFHLLTKNIPGFLQDYAARPGETPKRLYAEALLIDLVRRKAPAEEIKKTIVDARIMEDFKEYNRMYRQFKGNPSALFPRFGKTYWYYFHHAQL